MQALQINIRRAESECIGTHGWHNTYYTLCYKDEDRIFTNLYGRHDWGLKGAMSRVSVKQLFVCSEVVSLGSLVQDERDNLKGRQLDFGRS